MSALTIHAFAVRKRKARLVHALFCTRGGKAGIRKKMRVRNTRKRAEKAPCGYKVINFYPFCIVPLYRFSLLYYSHYAKECKKRLSLCLYSHSQKHRRIAPVAAVSPGRWFVGSLVRWRGYRRPASISSPTTNRQSNPQRAPSSPSNPTAADHRTRGAAAPSDRRFLKSFFDPRGPHFSIVGRGGTPPTDGHKNFSFLTL